MKTTTLAVGAALMAAVVSAGCDTFAHRAKQKAEVYNSLPSDTRQRLEKGRIAPGDSPDMVYIALGAPEEKRTFVSDDGDREVWIYKTYWQEYQGTQWVGWHRVLVPAPNGRGFVVFHEPITEDVYRTRAQEQIRVTFDHGLVESVDQAKGR